MKEIELRLRILGDPLLRRKAKALEAMGTDERALLSVMSRIMYDSKGVGLAAPQVGVSLALIVVDIGTGLYKLANPRIVKRGGSQAIEEGCLSVPGIGIKVKRARQIVVEALNEDGTPVCIEAEGMLACVLQHEIDHLHGKLIVDYATIIDKLKYKKQLKQLHGATRKERQRSS